MSSIRVTPWWYDGDGVWCGIRATKEAAVQATALLRRHCRQVSAGETIASASRARVPLSGGKRKSASLRRRFMSERSIWSDSGGYWAAVHT